MSGKGIKLLGNTKQDTTKNGAPLFLDTLAQLSTTNNKALIVSNLQNATYSKESLQKRARAKAFTYSYLFDLIDLKSPLNKGYWSTYHCSSVILQDEKTLSARFCNQRWCLVCNRIRTAKIINGYKESIEKFSNPHFLTLTIPNVKGGALASTIVIMNKAIRDITRNIKKTYKIQVKALKKYECTYNKITDEYHPHFHFIVETKEVGDLIINLWLNKFTDAKRIGQDLRITDENSLTELCKYFTKIVSKDNDYNPIALDIMFRAVKNKRTFQSIGIKKKVSEEVEEIEIQEIDFKAPTKEIYVYHSDSYDWVSSCGECLSEYKPTDKDLIVIKRKETPGKEEIPIKVLLKKYVDAMIIN